MNQLKILNKDKIIGIISKNTKLLTVKELLKEANYEFNELYIDKFWNNIEEDKWIYIDNDMLVWIGYNAEENYKNKQSYNNLIKDNFEENIDYKLMFSKEFNNISNSTLKVYRNKEINSHNKTKHLIISPDCFKQSLMLLRTGKSKEIKKYYIELEKIFRFYLEYQNQYKDKQLKEKDIELKEEKSLNTFISDEIVKYQTMNFDEYIYIVTTKLNAKNKLFKVGRTKDLTSRLGSYKTGHHPNDKFYYCFYMKTHSAQKVENIISYIFSSFKVEPKSELYHIDYNTLETYLKKICGDYNNWIEYYNQDILNNISNKNKEIIYIPNEYVQITNIPKTIKNIENNTTDIVSYTQPILNIEYDNDIKTIFSIFKYKENEKIIISEKQILTGFNNFFKQYVKKGQYNKLKEVNQYINSKLRNISFKIKRKRKKNQKHHFYIEYDEKVQPKVKEIKDTKISEEELKNKEDNFKKIEINVDTIDDDLNKIFNIFQYKNGYTNTKLLLPEQLETGFNNYFKSSVNENQYKKLKEMNQYMNVILKKNKLRIDRTRIRKNNKTTYLYFINKN